jgi:hypothetical protein
VVIEEIMADNAGGLEDEDLDHPRLDRSLQRHGEPS